MSRPVLHSNEKLIRAASRLFLKEGWEASTARIAKLAGVSEAILFKRFKTKAGLFEAAMDMQFRDDSWGAELLAKAGRNDPAANLEEALAALFLKLQTVVPKMMILRGSGMRPGPKRMLKDAPPLRDARVICEYLEAEEQHGRLRVSAPMMHAHEIVGSIVHYVGLREMSGYSAGEEGEYIRHLVATHLAAMKPPRRARKVPVLALAILLGLSSFASAKAVELPSGAITWMQCVKEAALNNPGLAAEEKDVQSSIASRRAAYSTFLPQVTATSGLSRSHNEQNTTTSATIVSDTGQSGVAATSFGSPTSKSSYSNSYSIQISLDQQLFDGFRTKGNVDKARAETGVALAKLLTGKAGVSYELKSAFAQLLYAQELIRISQDIIERRELNYRLVGLKYENGRENKGSLLLSKANLSQARVDFKQAGRTLRVSQIQLATVMGRKEYAAFTAKGELVTSEPMKDPDYQALALKTPAHFQQAATVASAKAGVTVAQSDFYPQINAYANLSGQSSTSYEMPKSWEAGIDGSWAIFDGAGTYFNVRAARATLDSGRATLRKTNADTAQTLAEDYRDLMDSIENVGVGQELLEASALRATIAEAQYWNGLVSFQDFDTITNDHITRQKADLQNRRDAVLAEAQWEESQGIGAIP